LKSAYLSNTNAMNIVVELSIDVLSGRNMAKLQLVWGHKDLELVGASR
jgi:hypothetical protein